MKKLARLTQANQHALAISPSKIATFETCSEQEKIDNPGARCAAWIFFSDNKTVQGFFLADSFSRLCAIAGRAGERMTIQSPTGKLVSLRPDDVEHAMEVEDPTFGKVTVIETSISNGPGSLIRFACSEPVAQIMDICGVIDEPEFEPIVDVVDDISNAQVAPSEEEPVEEAFEEDPYPPYEEDVPEYPAPLANEKDVI